MHISEAVRIANERRAANGQPPITVISNKQSPEYIEVFKIMNEDLYADIRRVLSVRCPDADNKERQRRELEDYLRAMGRI
jgi:hypothetical protein